MKRKTIVIALIILSLYIPLSCFNQSKDFDQSKDFEMKGTELVKYFGSATDVTIPKRVTSIEDWAFDGCESLVSVTIPSNVTSIGDYAFSDCSNLISITIPSSVTSIGSSAFSNCSSLTGITVDSQNPVYSSVDGVLFNKHITNLITYPAGKQESTYTIPSSVTSIGHWAFSECSNLVSITIPSSVTSIGAGAFVGCSNLTNVTVSRRTSIGENVFPDNARITYSD